MKATACNCGAITVEGEDFSNSMRPVVFRREFQGLRVNRKDATCYCDHCVNHWGIDLCGCGSGNKAGHCHDGYPECRRRIPAQQKGIQKESLFAAMTARGGF